MGPTCAGVENATMTEDNAALILDLINSIRSRAARGLAMGYENELLPRGYGMYRVEWDPELATLAQVWANTCVLERDNCRATKKFPDPGQQASIARFVTDKWIPISKTKDKTYNESSGFNSHKVIYGIKSCIRSWYNTHEEIDSEIIKDKAGNWNYELLRNPYLQIVTGPLTHMGCGTSAFTEYRYLTETTYLLYNVIRLVCNFSSRVYDDRGIYNVTPPTTPEFTSQCGCPPGYDEDSWCLCFKSEKNKTKPCPIHHNQKKTYLAVVPIFTVEDYPGPYKRSRTNKTKNLSLKKIVHQHTKSRAVASKGVDLLLDRLYRSDEKRQKQTQLHYNNEYEKESIEKDKAEFPIFLRRRNKKKHHSNNNNDLLPKSSRKNEKRKKIN
ncbi:unnamed protein product [Danaus chrysippus]|uniref:(African queen) hypothetical protein n=1 Tax=Danaus chrysippus TaxID=151541 RepID=A0A8J2QVI1_9NEOP|nr:unnamed protein product [Danaus chrysippus]